MIALRSVLIQEQRHAELGDLRTLGGFDQLFLLRAESTFRAPCPDRSIPTQSLIVAIGGRCWPGNGFASG